MTKKSMVSTIASIAVKIAWSLRRRAVWRYTKTDVNRIASTGSKLLEITNKPGWVRPFNDEVAEMIIAEADPAPRMAATNAEMSTSFRRIWSGPSGGPPWEAAPLLSGLEYHSFELSFCKLPLDGKVLISVYSVNLCALCASVVNKLSTKRSTTEAQRTLRLHREFKFRTPLG